VYAHLHPPWSDLPYRVGDTGGARRRFPPSPAAAVCSTRSCRLAAGAADPPGGAAARPCCWLRQRAALPVGPPCRGGAVNLLAPLDWFEGRWHCLLDMERGMLVLHPDVLLSGTRITSSHECPRRSFLDERVAEDGHNDKAVKGTLTHTLIQVCVCGGGGGRCRATARTLRVLRPLQRRCSHAAALHAGANRACLHPDLSRNGPQRSPPCPPPPAPAPGRRPR
jgi:hypothetical protein